MRLELHKKNSRFSWFYFSQSIDDVKSTEQRKKIHRNLHFRIRVVCNDELFDFFNSNCNFSKINNCFIQN